MAADQAERISHALSAVALRIDEQRRLGTDVPRCALCFEVSGDGGHLQRSLIVDAQIRVFEGPIILPGMPRATLRIAGVDLLALFAGKTTADRLIADGRLTVEGRVEILAGIAACFPTGKNWLSVRL